MSEGGREFSSISIGNMKKDPVLPISNGANKNNRLSSFAVPRDLSLGGLGAFSSRANGSKKIYAPNLKVIRNKNINIKTSKDTSSKVKKSQKGKCGIGKAGVNLIQTCGLFADGVGINVKKTVLISDSVKSQKSIAVSKPILIKDGKIDYKSDDSIISEYFGNISDVEAQTISYNCPVKLKSESKDFSESKFLGEMRDYSCLKQNNFETVFDSPKSELFLLQLPNTFPCDVNKNNCRELSNSALHPENNFSKHSYGNKYLKNMEEGQIGKLIKYKSGNFKLLLGSTHFNLKKGMNIGFVQEVVLIKTQKEHRDGNMISIGLIDEKLCAIPVWEILLRNN